MPADEHVILIENRKINGKYFKLSFESSLLASGVGPGQFLQIQIAPGCDPFLRRPFSYYRVQNGRIDILYEILGKGTALLSEKKSGERIRVLGPLGKSFRKDIGGKKRILVAGGIGVPPLVFVAERYGAYQLLIGAKSKDEILPKTEIADLPAPVLYATNDGTYGMKGYVTLLLEKALKGIHARDIFIQTCGPKPMMQKVLDAARRYGIVGEASLDENMACGVGACLGCMVSTKRGLVPSCKEGPVFSFEELDEKITHE